MRLATRPNQTGLLNQRPSGRFFVAETKFEESQRRVIRGVLQLETGQIGENVKPTWAGLGKALPTKRPAARPVMRPSGRFFFGSVAFPLRHWRARTAVTSGQAGRLT